MNTRRALSDFLPFQLGDKEIAFVEQSPYRTRTYTCGEVAEGIRRVATSLQSLSVQPGDRIILWGENSARWAMTFYACMVRRVVVVPIDFAFSQHFVEKIKSITQAKLVCSDRDPVMWETLFVSSVQDLPSEMPEESTLLEIIYTSGTTGEPKGVMITHRNVLSNLIPIWTEYQKYKLYAAPFVPLGFVHLIPLSHLFGQIMGLFIPQMLAAKVIFTDPSPPRVIRAVKKNRASVVICIPQELEILSRHISKRHRVEFPQRQRGGVSGLILRWWMFRRIHREFGWKFWAFIVGGATLPVQEESFWSGLGFAVIQGYGL